jgi:hypothetical protein
MLFSLIGLTILAAVAVIMVLKRRAGDRKFNKHNLATISRMERDDDFY